MILKAAIRAITACLGMSLWTCQVAAEESYSFKTPSQNIYCSYDDYSGTPEVRCDIISYTPTTGRRPSDCDLDWGDSFVIGANDSIGYVICHGDTVISPEAETLPYGATWQKGGIACTSETTGLSCKNGKGHGFLVSKAKQKVF